MGLLQQNDLSVVFKVQVLEFHSRGTKSISLLLKLGWIWDGKEERMSVFTSRNVSPDDFYECLTELVNDNLTESIKEMSLPSVFCTKFGRICVL